MIEQTANIFPFIDYLQGFDPFGVDYVLVETNHSKSEVVKTPNRLTFNKSLNSAYKNNLTRKVQYRPNYHQSGFKTHKYVNK